MTASRWPLAELVERLCAKLNAPKPSSLGAAALAESAFHADLIDSIYDAAQRLMLQLNPEELYETTVLHTRALSLVTVACLNGSTSIAWTAGTTGTDDAVNWSFPIFGLQSYDGIFELSDVEDDGSGNMTATLDRTFPLESGNYEGYVLTREIALPTDYKSIRDRLYNITGTQKMSILTFNQVEEMRQTHSAIDLIRLAPGTAKYVTVNRQYGGTPYLMTYPATITRQDIRVPYIRDIGVYDPTTDDATTTYLPLPPHHQHLIIDAVLVEVLGHQLADGRENQAYYEAMKRLSEHLTLVDKEYDKSRNETRIEPTMYRGSRRMWRSGSHQLRNPRDFDRE